MIRAAALFNPKARLWVNGRRGLQAKIAAAMHDIHREKRPVVWFHVSSLGEFEQGRPVIEAFRKRWPGKIIVLTFFSPSGYEIRKDYDQVDFVFYLPADTPGNVRRFLDAVKPGMAFFVKYDFWFNYMKALHDRHIPLCFISVLLRDDHWFFQWYGRWPRKQLSYVTRFFVQNPESAELLKRFGIDRVTIAGDTRFDRVAAIAARQAEIPVVEKFCAGREVLIAGSSWQPDEELILPLINRREFDIKYILAPHDTSPERVRSIRNRITLPVITFSELNENNAAAAEVLIIDSVGILSKLYRYATVAFIGGGFGKGIHNIQEPVTFGVPVFFGPAYHKFREARDLVQLGGVFSIPDTATLVEKTGEILGNPSERQRISDICKAYVAQNCGATVKIISYLETTPGG
jgi:3-deoxy-D-manno-octulosonic-acid transferase